MTEILLIILNQHYLTKMKTDYPDDKETERTDKIIENFINQFGQPLTQLYLVW